MTPPDEPPSNPYDPTWPRPEQPYGQTPEQPYGQQQVPYGQAPYGQPMYGGPLAPKHPSATTAMVLGISALGGMLLCGLPIVLAPFAWMTGSRAVKEIDAQPGRFSGREQAQAGRIMGMIGTALLALGVIAIIAFLVLAVAVGGNDLSSELNTGDNTSASAL